MKRWIGASVCCFMLGGGQGIVAQKVIFPQEVQANKAQLESNENEWTLKNALLTAKFAKVDGKLIFDGCEEMNLSLAPNCSRWYWATAVASLRRRWSW